MNEKIITLRHLLHSRPEVSNHEYETAAIIREFIEQYEPTELIAGIGGAGLAVIYDFGGVGKTIAIRCELDALPILEKSDLSYRSVHDGVSHKCGHDGHMAIVASLGPWLQTINLDQGKVVLLFQPAEENGQGAERIVSDERFRNLNVDHIFALHNLPQEALHDIIVMERGFSAEVISCIIRLTGKESHAAEPENGTNPTLAISDITARCSQLGVSNPEDASFAVLTPVHIRMGQAAYGISPGDGELHYTIRTWTSDKMQQLRTDIVDIISERCQAHGLSYDIEWLEYFPASINDEESNDIVRQAAMTHAFNISERTYPFKFGEDFGRYTDLYKTAIFGLGAGYDTPALHHATYDFPDEIIETGSDMFKSIIMHILGPKQ